jgi:hypothetical protein
MNPVNLAVLHLAHGQVQDYSSSCIPHWASSGVTLLDLLRNRPFDITMEDVTYEKAYSNGYGSG